jgi:hypothetical protein
MSVKTDIVDTETEPEDTESETANGDVQRE